MLRDLKALVGAREILYMLSWRDIKIRYKQSLMGLMWAILMPSLIVGAGILVRLAAAKYTATSVSDHDLASVIFRATFWSLFVSSIRFGTNSLVANNNLISKLAFPKEVFPLASVASCLFDFLIAFTAALIILLVTGWRPSLDALWAAPILLTFVMLSAGLAMLLSAMNLFYRDVKYVVEVFLTYAIFFTPVLYEVSIAGKWRNLLLVNPVAPLLEALADTLVWRRPPNALWTAYGFIASVLIAAFGYWTFKRLEADFAERI